MSGVPHWRENLQLPHRRNEHQAHGLSNAESALIPQDQMFLFGWLTLIARGRVFFCGSHPFTMKRRNEAMELKPWKECGTDGLALVMRHVKSPLGLAHRCASRASFLLALTGR
jgi:hypothetical protein